MKGKILQLFQWCLELKVSDSFTPKFKKYILQTVQKIIVQVMWWEVVVVSSSISVSYEKPRSSYCVM